MLSLTRFSAKNSREEVRSTLPQIDLIIFIMSRKHLNFVFRNHERSHDNCFLNNYQNQKKQHETYLHLKITAVHTWNCNPAQTKTVRHNKKSLQLKHRETVENIEKQTMNEGLGNNFKIYEQEQQHQNDNM